MHQDKVYRELSEQYSHYIELTEQYSHYIELTEQHSQCCIKTKSAELHQDKVYRELSEQYSHCCTKHSISASTASRYAAILVTAHKRSCQRNHVADLKRRRASRSYTL